MKTCAGSAFAGRRAPICGGPFAPYQQSRRMPVYLDAWRKLYRRGCLFPCKCSRKDLESALGAPHEISVAGVRVGGKLEPLDDEPIYPGTCRNSGAAPGNFPGPTWRARHPQRHELALPRARRRSHRVRRRNLGRQRFVAGIDFGDFVVWRRDGTPSYQLACVADDAAMRITEVVRGADLLLSTARQILLYRALGLTPPSWFHCRLVLDHNGRRLAKRHDGLSIRTLRQRGVTPMNILGAELPLSA